MTASSWFLFAAAAFSAVHIGFAQIQPGARSGVGCASTGDKIYCYGGRSYSNEEVTSTNMNDFYSLDVSKPFTLQAAQSSWQGISAGGLDPAPNFLFGFVNVPGSNDILMQGGLGYDNGSAIPYQTVVYDPDTNAWRSIDSTGVPQVYQASLVAVNETLFVRYGGVSDLGTGYTLGSYYPPAIYFLEYSSGQWYYDDVPSQIGARCLQAVFLGNDGASIYYVGGLVATPTANYTNGTIDYSLSGAPMNEVLIYNTSTLQWNIRQTTSVITPPARRIPTATKIPGTNNVIIYGGADLSLARPLADYLYILDFEQMAWTRINPSGNGAGPRYTHGAVLINNSSLFIMFGIDNTGTSRNDFSILDINTWTWQSDFMMNNSTNSSNGSSDNGNNGSNGDDGGNGGGISGGAIAGAVVGSVAGAGIICGLLAFFLLRKRRQRKEEEGEKDGADKHMYQQDYDNAGAAPPPPRYDDNISPITSTSGFHMPPPAPGFHSYDNQSSSRTSMVTTEIGSGGAQHRNVVVENAISPSSSHFHQDSFSVATSSEGVGSAASPIHAAAKPDAHITSIKPDIGHEEGNIPTLKLQPMRPDGE